MIGIEVRQQFLVNSDCRRLIEVLFDLFLDQPRRVNKDNRSCVLRYGWDYEAPIKKLALWPDWIETIRKNLPHPVPEPKCAVTVNEYRKGHRITPHIDSERFGETIQTVSIGSSATLRLTRGGEKREFELANGSLCILSGEARHLWQHEILPVDGLRYSIVFREYSPKP